MSASTTLVPSICRKIKAALESKLESIDSVEEKIRLIEILVRWRPLNEQLAFVLDIANKKPALSANDRFGLEYMTISGNSSEEDKVSVLNSFIQLSQAAKLNHAHNTFQIYHVLLEIDSSQGYVSYRQPLSDAVDAFVLPDIPDLSGEPFIPEGIPEFSTEDEFETWASQNPADAHLLKEALSIGTSDSLVEGMFSRLKLELGIQGLPNSASEFANIVGLITSDTELYHTLLEIHQCCQESDFVREYFESIRTSNIIQTRVSNLRSDPRLSSGKISAVEKLHLIFWPD